MKVHPIIASAVVAAILTLQGWMLKEISSLRETVAVLSAQMTMHINSDTKPIAKR